MEEIERNCTISHIKEKTFKRLEIFEFVLSTIEMCSMNQVSGPMASNIYLDLFSFRFVDI